jgi:putative membrane protein
MGFLIRVLVNALALWLATAIVPGIEARSGATILGAALVLGLINAVVRPVLLVVTFPLTLVSLGLFIFVLNAFCLWLTAALVKGFTVRGFWAALFGAIIVSAVSWTATAFLSDQGKLVVITGRHRWPR